MTWTSRIPDWIGKLNDALPDALDSAAEHYEEAVKEVLIEGYTSGKFVTGVNADAVTIYALERDGDDWLISIGTPELIAVYWELGFHNHFTKEFQRVEVWRPTFDNEVDAMKEIIIEKLEDITV